MNCDLCLKKINIIDQTMCKCRCSKFFCKTHRLPSQHSCQFNYVFDSSKLQKCVASKI